MPPIPGKTPLVLQHTWARRVLRSVQFGLSRIMSPNGYVEARAAIFDLRFVGPAADCNTRHIYRLGAHEPDITRYLIETISLASGEIAMDVGANLGWYSVLLSRLSMPGARIFAFEPDPTTFQLLCRNLAANSASGVTPLNVALGEAPGTAMLHRYKASNNGRHTLCPGTEGGGGECQVSVRTLDEFCESQALGHSRIRFLKIDVEGFEYFVLRGATKLLERCDCVLLEFNQGPKAAELVQLLADSGFTARTFTGGTVRPVSYPEILQSPTQLDLLLTPARLAVRGIPDAEAGAHPSRAC